MSEPRLPVPHRRRRAAITLIEVLGTLSILLVLAVSAASILGAVTEIGIRVGRDNHGRVSIERLAKQFRSDVHLAGDITATDNDWPIELTTQSGLVRYDYDDKTSVLRRWQTPLRENDDPTTDTDGRASSPERRDGPRAGAVRGMVDEFRLPQRCDPRVSVSDDMVSIHLTGDDTSQPWVIEVSR